MELTQKQLEGLEIALKRFQEGEKYTVISGYAGTGKSTLVRFIIAALEQYGIKEDDVVYTAFTGKATQVLQKKGNKNVSTLHKLLYEYYPIASGGFRRFPIRVLPYKVVVVDECSMAPKELMQELYKKNVYIICLGDPGQLPPLRADDDNHLLDNPHIFLDEIMRQAAESEIIQLSMKIRNDEPIDFFQGKEVQVLRQSDLNTGMLQWADQIICATNATRVKLNNQMRDLLGRGNAPEDGDKVICLRNYWEIISDSKSALVNGTIGYLENTTQSFLQIPYHLTADRKSKKIDIVLANFISDSEEYFDSLTMDKKMILEGEYSLDWKTTFKMSKRGAQPPLEFTYGYAITGHKSQGSEWDKVLIIEEKFPFKSEEHKRWLYTCVTRAAKKLVLIRPD